MPAFMPLHRGAHGFMSLKQFEIFYWPYLLKVIARADDEGIHTGCLLRGGLQFAAGIPRANCRRERRSRGSIRSIWQRAKEILGGKVCIAGNMPVSVLQVGTADDVKKKCKELIDTAGKDGGYIMAPASALDEVNPENLKAMIEFTKEYGKYR